MDTILWESKEQPAPGLDLIQPHLSNLESLSPDNDVKFGLLCDFGVKFSLEILDLD